MDFLQEKDVFREFLYRINTLGTQVFFYLCITYFLDYGCLEIFLPKLYWNLWYLGWSNRTQFEETWATLLGVLVTQPITMDQEEETQQEVTTFIFYILGCFTLSMV